MRPAARSWLVAVAVGIAGAAAPALAHTGLGGSVETRLTFPPWVVWASGALVVALSFAVVGAFLTRSHGAADASGPPRMRVVAVARREAATGWTPLRTLGAAVLGLAVLNGFLPASDSLLPQTLLWLVVWAALPLLAYTVGDLWPRVSPFHGLAAVADTARGARDPRPWPARLGAWPATVLFLALVGLEVSGADWAHRPGPLALALLAYTLLTVTGMMVFGADAWLPHAEVVTRMMRWWRAVSPLAWENGRPHWRGFVAPLSRLPVVRFDDVAFTVAILYGVNFDGFVATGAGAAALAALSPLGTALSHLVVLLVGYGAFLGVWYGAARGIRNASESLHRVPAIAAAFAASLLPIAVGYHAAHHVFTLLEQAPRLLYAAIDPIGLGGWPEVLFHPPTTLTIPSALDPWLAGAQVALVLIGHLVAVVVAHRLAERTFPSRIMALRGEVPLTLVMVVYTWVGLWVLSGAGGVAA